MPFTKHDHETSSNGSRAAPDLAGIRALLDAWANAVRAADADAMLRLCAPDLATFDLVPPLRHHGASALRRLWSDALGTFQKPVELEVHQLEIIADGDVAFCRSLNRFGGTRKDGARVVSWMCSTLGLRRTDGQWKVVHEHVSVPFDMRTGEALLDLEP